MTSLNGGGPRRASVEPIGGPGHPRYLVQPQGAPAALVTVWIGQAHGPRLACSCAATGGRGQCEHIRLVRERVGHRHGLEQPPSLEHIARLLDGDSGPASPAGPSPLNQFFGGDDDATPADADPAPEEPAPDHGLASPEPATLVDLAIEVRIVFPAGGVLAHVAFRRGVWACSACPGEEETCRHVVGVRDALREATEPGAARLVEDLAEVVIASRRPLAALARDVGVRPAALARLVAAGLAKRGPRRVMPWGLKKNIERVIGEEQAGGEHGEGEEARASGAPPGGADRARERLDPSGRSRATPAPGEAPRGGGLAARSGRPSPAPGGRVAPSGADEAAAGADRGDYW